jgi:hypothetical protein
VTFGASAAVLIMVGFIESLEEIKNAIIPMEINLS